MSVEVELFDDLDAVARDADGALDRAAQPLLFDRLDFYRLTLAHCPPRGRPLVARARRGEASAWLFLSVEGNRARALTSWYSLHFDAVRAAAGADEGALLRALATALRRRKLGRIELSPMPQASPLPEAFRQTGWQVVTGEATANWIAHVEGLDFDAYWARRPARLRNTARRKAKAANLDIRIARSFDAALWRDYWEVYRQSWKPEEGSPAFLEALGRAESDAGTLRLAAAYKEGEPLAAQLWLVENGIATIHKLAYVDAARALSPGTILSAAMFAHVIGEDRPRLIDFGTGDDGYKADWMDERRSIIRLEAYNPATATGLASLGRRAASALVRRLRSH